MYSAVLVAALVTTSSTPNFGFHRHGCYSACHGCYGGGYGCSSYGHGYGAAGGCYGYHGGCYGTYGVIYADPYAYYGGPYSNYPPHAFYGCTGCYGAYGGYSCYGVPVPLGVNPPVKVIIPAKDPLPEINPDGKKKDTKEPEEVGAPKEKPKKKIDDKKIDPNNGKETTGLELNVQMRAKVRIDIPEGGRLFVDGKRINVAAGVRTFQTPLLRPGETYFYDIRIEIERNGVLRGEDRRLIIRPGEDVAVNFLALRPPGVQTAQVGR